MYNWRMKLFLSVVFCLIPLSAQAFTALVIKVSDGDTVTVTHDGEKQRVRVFGIDAPEHDQPGGTQAKHDMTALALGKTVEVDPPFGKRKFPHSYNRIVATLTTPEGTDIGWTLLTLGDAWAYDQFKPPRQYDEAMTQAASIHEGLWAAPEPIAPWDWRRAHHVGHYR